MKLPRITPALLPSIALLAASIPGLGRQDAPEATRSADELAAVLENVREAVGWSAFAKAQGELRLAGTTRRRGEDGEFELLFTSRGEFVRVSRGKFPAARGYDGETAWSRDRSGLTRELEMRGRDLSLFEHWVATGYWLDPAAPFDLALLASEGEARRIRIDDPASPIWMTLEIDGESWLPRALTYNGAAGDYVWSFGDWRKVGVLRVPHSLSAADSGGLADTYHATEAGPAPAFVRSPYAFHPRGAEDVTYDSAAQGELESQQTPTGHLLVKPLVNGKDIGWFIFDTGAGALCIDPAAADSLELPAFGEETAVGVAGKTTTCFREAESIALGPTTISDPYFVEIDLSFLEQYFGVAVGGVVGYDYLARTVIELETATGRIAAFVPSEYELEGASWQPLRLDENLPVVHASFEGDREGPFKLDTGANGSVTFHTPTVNRLKLLEGRKVVESVLMGHGGSGKSYSGVIEWFELGGHRFEKQQASFSQTETGGMKDAYTLGNIGQLLLRPFRLVFDYPHGRIAFANLRQEHVLPCDTWVALPDATAGGATILAKNSDRTVFDCQPLLFHPRRTWEPGTVIDLGRTTVPQVAETFATLGSSPYWCWGYEEGINEHGVAIGNEGIFTRARTEDVAAHARGEGPPLGPTGMDLLRLALERSRTAREAVDMIGYLLEEHGQFGSGLPMMPPLQGAYDNSFIVADPNEAWVVETCGRTWVARRFREGTTSISNVPSIRTEWDLASDGLVEHAVERGWWPADEADAFDFMVASCDPSPLVAPAAERARTRAKCSAGLLAEKEGSVTPRWMMRIARDRSTDPSLDLDVTASSCVAVLPKGEDALTIFWWCPSTPSNGCFVPFFVQGAGLPTILSTAGTVGRVITPPTRVAQDGFSEESYWWRFRDLCDLVRMDYAERNSIVRRAFDPLELEFEKGLASVLEEAAALRREGHEQKASERLAAYSAACVDRALTTLDGLREQLRAMEIEIPETCAPYVGGYAAVFQGRDVRFEIFVRDAKLWVRLPDGRDFELLEPDEEGWRYFALTDQASVSFEREGEAPAAKMIFRQPGATIELDREEGDG